MRLMQIKEPSSSNKNNSQIKGIKTGKKMAHYGKKSTTPSTNQ